MHQDQTRVHQYLYQSLHSGTVAVVTREKQEIVVYVHTIIVTALVCVQRVCVCVCVCVCACACMVGVCTVHV